MTSTNSLSRRSILRAATASGAMFATSSLFGARSANETLNLAFIGVGGRGLANLNTITKAGNDHVVAICDVNASSLGKAKERFPKARDYQDFRKLYENAKDIDAVVVSTTEHTHAYATMPALKMGKPVYCEKPLTRDVEEARRITKAAKEANVATQMGTQIHGMPNYRRVVELIQSNAIGPVREIHVWVSRAWGLQSPEEAKAHRDIVSIADRPKESVKPPANIDWDLWIGPAPMRPFHPVYVPGPKWYRWWDFGNGTMSDLGSHWIDLPFWALELDAPLTVESQGPEPHPELAPASMTATYEYGPRGELPACKLTWYQGKYKPKIWEEKGIPQWGNGVLFIGDKGMLLSDYGKHKLLPEETFQDFKGPEPFLPVSPGQHQEWLLACKTGRPTSSPFSYSGPLTEANHLGNVAFRAGKKIEWDAKNMQIVNCPDANQFLSRTPRSGWSLD